MVSTSRIATFAVLLAVAWAQSVPAQGVAAAGTRSLTYEQVFGQPPGPPREDGPGEGGILGRLPSITAWLDDATYLETRKDPADGERRLYAVKAADGTAVGLPRLAGADQEAPGGIRRAAVGGVDARPWHGWSSTATATSTSSTSRPAPSAGSPRPRPRSTIRRSRPTAQWLAYTRGNNLFAYDLAAGLERQLTSDGSEHDPQRLRVVGVHARRSSAAPAHYRGVLVVARQRRGWRSCASTTRPVPVFPLYRADGQHGELEMQRYPKAGDPNPYVQAGVVSVADGRPYVAGVRRRRPTTTSPSRSGRRTRRPSSCSG